MDLTEIHLLHLGNISEGSRVIFRWDLVFDMVSKKEDFMFHCSKSSVNITDRQDPSLAGEIASTYRFFLKQNFDGMGIYLKALQMFLEAFYDEAMSPGERMQKAWYVKTFCTLWDKNTPSSSSFVSRETFKDIICALDGLFLYMLRLKKDIPKAPI